MIYTVVTCGEQVAATDGGRGHALDGVWSRCFFGDKVVGASGVAVDRTREATRGAHSDFYRSFGIEENLVVGMRIRHGGEVVGLTAIERFGENVSALTIDAHFFGAAEAHSIQLIVGQFVDAVLVDLDFHPMS